MTSLLARLRAAVIAAKRKYAARTRGDRSAGFGTFAGRFLGARPELTSKLARELASILALGGAFFLAGAPWASASSAPAAAAVYAQSEDVSRLDDAALLEDLSRRTFDYFWKTANPANGLVPDRFPTPSFSSIAAVGFGLTAYGIGAERGYVSRADAAERTLRTLRFFANAPQSKAGQGVTGYKGFFYHFLDARTGARYRDVELSTIDTALLLAGALFSQSYFDRDLPVEREIRRLVDKIYARVDWRFMQARGDAIAHGWVPGKGFIASDWVGYDEAMILYVLALGAPAKTAIAPAAWGAWTKGYGDDWGVAQGIEHLQFPPLFGHQYSHVWVDFRGLRDDFMAGKNSDYFENSRRATLAQARYAIANPHGFKGYDALIWGLSASDGPIDAKRLVGGREVVFRTYAARGMESQPAQGRFKEGYDDGTIAPTAALGSIAFAPEIVVPTLRAFRARYGKAIYGEFGFLDSFNPSFEFAGPLHHGRVFPGLGWVDGDYLGIDQGPILAMVENYRSGLVWRVMRNNPYIRRGLLRAGFTGGWLEAHGAK